ncbi:hypothetical protein Tco_0865991 [Tanacetum coccineum]
MQHQDSRIKKAQELKTNTDIKDPSPETKIRGRLLASFQNDAKYEHVGQDTRSQDGKDNKDTQGKDLKISKLKTKSKDNEKSSRSKITQHEGTSLQGRQRPRSHELNDKSNLIDLMKECHNKLTSGEIDSLKILSRTRKFGYTTAIDLLKAITLVINLWLAGRCPSILAEFLASPSFTHLLKLDNEIRPIAVGTIWRRLVSKVAMKGGFLMGSQRDCRYEAYIYGLPLGCSKATHWDLLFVLVVHPLIHKIRDNCKLLLHTCEMVKDMEVHFDMTVRQKAVFECLRAPHAQDFLLAIPIDGLGQHMSPVEYRTILKYRLMIPLFPVDEICPVCRKACLDSFGEHAVHCKELSGFKYRHDMVRDVLFDVCRRVGISAKKEALANFLTDPLDGRSTLGLADVLNFGWVGGKHTCVDLTEVSPLMGLSSRGFTVGQLL